MFLLFLLLNFYLHLWNIQIKSVFHFYLSLFIGGYDILKHNFATLTHMMIQHVWTNTLYVFIVY